VPHLFKSFCRKRERERGRVGKKMSTKPPLHRSEVIPPSLLPIFDVPSTLLARHVLKYTSNKRTTNKILILGPDSIVLCDSNGNVSRYIPFTKVTHVMWQARQVLIKVSDGFDVLFDVPEDKKNTSQDIEALVAALVDVCRHSTGRPEFVAEEKKDPSLAPLLSLAHLVKGGGKPYPVQKFSHETQRILLPPVAKEVIADEFEVEIDKLPRVAAAKQRALEAEIAYLRQRLQENEQIRSLQSQVDELQRVLFEKQSARNGVATADRRRPHLIRPRMPDFIPGVTLIGSLETPNQFQLQSNHASYSFLANKDLWRNLVRVTASPTHGREPPVVALTSSHSSEIILVGRVFLQDFLMGWSQHNCHYIIVTYVKENESMGFYATTDFWKFVGGASDLLIPQSQQTVGSALSEEDHTTSVVTVQCDKADKVMRTTLKHWNELAEKWTLTIR